MCFRHNFPILFAVIISNDFFCTSGALFSTLFGLILYVFFLNLFPFSSRLWSLVCCLVNANFLEQSTHDTVIYSYIWYTFASLLCECVVLRRTHFCDIFVLWMEMIMWCTLWRCRRRSDDNHWLSVRRQPRHAQITLCSQYKAYIRQALFFLFWFTSSTALSLSLVVSVCHCFGCSAFFGVTFVLILPKWYLLYYTCQVWFIVNSFVRCVYVAPVLRMCMWQANGFTFSLSTFFTHANGRKKENASNDVSLTT